MIIITPPARGRKIIPQKIIEREEEEEEEEEYHTFFVYRQTACAAHA